MASHVWRQDATRISRRNWSNKINDADCRLSSQVAGWSSHIMAEQSPLRVMVMMLVVVVVMVMVMRVMVVAVWQLDLVLLWWGWLRERDETRCSGWPGYTITGTNCSNKIWWMAALPRHSQTNTPYPTLLYVIQIRYKVTKYLFKIFDS